MHAQAISFADQIAELSAPTLGPPPALRREFLDVLQQFAEGLRKAGLGAAIEDESIGCHKLVLWPSHRPAFRHSPWTFVASMQIGDVVTSIDAQNGVSRMRLSTVEALKMWLVEGVQARDFRLLLSDLRAQQSEAITAVVKTSDEAHPFLNVLVSPKAQKAICETPPGSLVTIDVSVVSGYVLRHPSYLRQMLSAGVACEIVKARISGQDLVQLTLLREDAPG